MNGIVAQSAEQVSLTHEVQGSTPCGPTKLCSKCGLTKSVDDFHRRGKGRQPYCKQCKKEDDERYYQAHRPYFDEQKKKAQEKLMAWYYDLKSHPCTDCGGVFHPKAMQYDHRPGEDKVMHVSKMLARGFGKNRILAEVAKCDLVCANCHAVRTDSRL